MSKKLIKISFEEAKERIEGQIQKGKKLSQIGLKQSRDTRDRDNFKTLFEQWAGFTYESLNEIFVSNSYSRDFKEKKSSKVQYVGSDWIPDIKYYLEKQLIPKIDFLEILNQNLGEFEEINIKDSSQGHETSLILTSDEAKNKAINAEKSMNLRERIENNLTLWLLGVAVSSFIAGIGAYKGILEIAKLDTIQKGTYVEREQYDLLQKNFNDLKSKFQLLNDTLSEIDIDKVNPNLTSRFSLPIKFVWERQSNMVLQVYKQGRLIFSEEHSSPYVINRLPTGLSEIKFWIPGEATSFKSIWIEIID